MFRFAMDLHYAVRNVEYKFRDERIFLCGAFLPTVAGRKKNDNKCAGLFKLIPFRESFRSPALCSPNHKPERTKVLPFVELNVAA